jgi:hypothetical protein
MSSIYHTDHVAPAGGVVFAVDFAISGVDHSRPLHSAGRIPSF